MAARPSSSATSQRPGHELAAPPCPARRRVRPRAPARSRALRRLLRPPQGRARAHSTCPCRGETQMKNVIFSRALLYDDGSGIETGVSFDPTLRLADADHQYVRINEAYVRVDHKIGRASCRERVCKYV